MQTVKCLEKAIKDLIVHEYTKFRAPLVVLAKTYGVSTRTIGRVLEERGLATPVPRLKGEAYIVLEACKIYGIEPKDLPDYLATTRPHSSYGKTLDFIAKANQEQLTGVMHAINHRINAMCADLRDDSIDEERPQLNAAVQEGAADGRPATA
jgi:hypothetical protein